MDQNMARFAWEKPGERARSFGNAKIQTIKHYMQLFQQKFLQKISFWKTFPPNKNHNNLQINKLKFFPENFPTKPPSLKYFFHTPHHQSICQSIASIKPTSSTATTSPKKRRQRWSVMAKVSSDTQASISNPIQSPSVPTRHPTRIH